MPSQTACAMKERLLASMLPQVGAGGGTPRPRKLRALSDSSTQPNIEVASTVIGATQFGRIWRTIVKISELPITREASTNSCSRSDSTAPRTMRATEGV